MARTSATIDISQVNTDAWSDADWSLFVRDGVLPRVVEFRNRPAPRPVLVAEPVTEVTDHTAGFRAWHAKQEEQAEVDAAERADKWAEFLERHPLRGEPSYCLDEFDPPPPEARRCSCGTYTQRARCVRCVTIRFDVESSSKALGVDAFEAVPPSYEFTRKLSKFHWHETRNHQGAV